MPIDYVIDHARRVVVARGRGALTREDIYAYQNGAWPREDVTGYDEIVDMTNVETIVLPNPERMRELAAHSAAMDPPGVRGGRFAIVAPSDYAFGLGRMYQAFRDLEPQSAKRVEVFRTMEEALAFLNLDGLPAAGD